MRLLLVEPHTVLARSVKRGLEEESFIVEHVTDNDAAHERVREGLYHVIILGLPIDTMLATLRAWRCADLRTPVMLLSEPGRGSERCEALRSENWDVCTKPFSLEALLVRLRTLVHNSDTYPREPPREPRAYPQTNDLRVVRSSVNRYTLPVTCGGFGRLKPALKALIP
jgi:DNA-binding response OmpR family regulator